MQLYGVEYCLESWDDCNVELVVADSLENAIAICTIVAAARLSVDPSKILIGDVYEWDEAVGPNGTHYAFKFELKEEPHEQSEH